MRVDYIAAACFGVFMACFAVLGAFKHSYSNFADAETFLRAAEGDVRFQAWRVPMGKFPRLQLNSDVEPYWSCRVANVFVASFIGYGDAGVEQQPERTGFAWSHSFPVPHSVLRQ